MTRDEALRFLSQHATHSHRVTYSTVGPSHGDPGGYSVITSACPCVAHDGYSVKRQDDTGACTCGTTRHNLKVKVAIELLRATANEGVL